MAKRNQLTAYVSILLLVCTLATAGATGAAPPSHHPPGGETRPRPEAADRSPVEPEDLPAPLPRDCDGITPVPPACCVYGYVYEGSLPVGAANVHIASPYGSLDTTTASGPFSDQPYYQVDLSSPPLSTTVGTPITFTVSYGGMTASRSWTVQSDGQQVDLGLALLGGQLPVTPTAWTRLTTNPYDDLYPDWSPGGSQIAWTHFGDSWYRDVWQMAADGTGATPLTDGEVDEAADYAPAGQQIVFVRYHDDTWTDIVVKDLELGGETVIRGSGYNGHPRWSPDGARIVFQSADHMNGTYHLYTMNPDGTDVSQLTNAGWINSSPEWSPDGSRILFVSDRAGGYRDEVAYLYVMDADGSNVRQLTSGAVREGLASWSPDGRHIAVTRSLGTPSSHIYVLLEDGTSVVQFTDSPGTEGYPAWSPAGDTLAFAAEVTGTWDIYVVDFPLAQDRIYFSSNRSGHHQLYSVNPNGKDLLRLTDHASDDRWPDLSDDGRTLVFASTRTGDWEVFKANAAAGDPQNLTNDPGLDRVPRISPDSSRIAYQHWTPTTEDDLYRMASDGSEIVCLTGEPSDDENPSWSLDGTLVYYDSDRLAGGYVDDICRITADGTDPTCLTNHPSDDTWPAVSPDGTRIVFSSARSGNYELYVMDAADGGNVQQLTNHPAGDTQPAWSPDGSRIAFVSDRDGNQEIYTMAADGTDLVRVTQDPADDIDPDWEWAATPTGWTRLRRIQITSEPTWQGQPTVLPANGHYYVAHTNIVSGDWCDGNWDVFVREFDADWNYVREIRITEAPTAEQHAAIGFADGKFSVVYSSRDTACAGSGHVFVQEYDAGWNYLRTIQLTAEGWLEEYPSLLLLNDNYYVGYNSYETGDSEIYFKRYDTNWNFMEKISGLTDSEPGLQEQPNLASNGTEWAVSYISYQGGDWHVYVRTFDLDWAPLRWFRIDTAPAADKQYLIYADGQYHISYASQESSPPGVFVNHYTADWTLIRKEWMTEGMYASDSFLADLGEQYLLAFDSGGDAYVDLYVAGPQAVRAAFAAVPLVGPAPLEVHFADRSSGDVSAWTWEFGDGASGGARYPVHTYEVTGTYTVSLTVVGWGGTDRAVATDYIHVPAGPISPPLATITAITPSLAMQGRDIVHFDGCPCQDQEEGGESIVAYNWRSDQDGWLSDQEDFALQASALSTGTHVIFFQVQDDEGEWSAEVSRTLNILPWPAGARTLILANRSKLEALYSGADADQVLSRLSSLAAHDRVRGIVVLVEADPAVAAAYAAWEADPTSTAQANAVTASIKAVITNYWSTFPGLEYLVIVGDDRVIPFRRVPDQTAYPESHYQDVSCTSTVGAALCDDMTLTDDYYADAVPTVPDDPGWDGHDLYIPDLGVGRLVETPAEINAQVDTFLAGNEVGVDGAIVTGYDFVRDSAQAMCAALRDDGITTDCTLVGNSWDRDLFVGRVLNTRHVAAAVNSHANHYTIGTPSGDVYSSDVVGALADLARALFYSLGCHAGLNVPPDNPVEPLDLPEALVQQRANLVANTGYGWAYITSIGLSEQLMLDLTERLTYGQSATVGQALSAAKHEYYLNEGSFDYYDEKIMIESQLCGLPMYRYQTPGGAMARSGAGAEPPVRQQFHSTSLGDGLTVNSISYQFPAVTPQWTELGMYYTFGGKVHNGPGQPLQPKYVADVSFPQTKAHGVVFRGGTYTDVAVFDPVVEQAITTTDMLPEPAFDAPYWYPAVFYRLNRLEPAASLVTLLGQFNAPGMTERLYDRLGFDIYYHTTSSDWQAPVLSGMRSWLVTGTAAVVVQVGDASGIAAVVVAYDQGQGSWSSVALQADAGSWQGSFPAQAGTSFVVQVVDGAGNVLVQDNGGAYFHPGDGLNQIYLPLVVRGQ